jgi:hypothetical protein
MSSRRQETTRRPKITRNSLILNLGVLKKLKPVLLLKKGLKGELKLQKMLRSTRLSSKP